jgi:hypothetical protein
MAKATPTKRDWGTLFYNRSSGAVRLWYCRGQIYTVNELAEANIHPLRSRFLGQYTPQTYDADKVSSAAARIADLEKKKGLEVVEADRARENVALARSTRDGTRFRLTPAQTEAIIAGRSIEFGDLFGVMVVGGPARTPEW